MMERRRRERVPLKLPIRLHWHAPIIPLLEPTETVDVSRTGLLVRRPEPCRVRARLWVRYPFVGNGEGAHPETPARVAHVKRAAESGYLIGLAFENPPDAAASYERTDRRTNERVTLALPVRARHADMRWPEDTLTGDVSEMGVRFYSSRFYSTGDLVRVAFTYLQTSRESAEEISGRVVRVEPMADSCLDAVAVRLASATRARGAPTYW